MKLRSFSAILLIMVLSFLLYMRQTKVLRSEIVTDESTLSFFLADSYEISEAQQIFKYNSDQQPASQLQELETNCRKQQGVKFVLIQSAVDGHIIGGYNTDTCWKGTKPKEQLTPFTFSMNSSERILFMPDRKRKKAAIEGFLFGPSVFLKPNDNSSGIQLCFNQGTIEMGRAIGWFSTTAGKCVPVARLELYNVKIRETMDIKGKFQEFMDQELVDIQQV